jgi:hypothetical protein
VIAHDGSIVLPARATLTLSDADGMEMAYSTTTARSPMPLYWSPLTGSLRLPDDADVRVIHLRDPSLGQESILTLARRSLKVDIDMTPRNPQPGVPIDVRAVAWDPTHRLDPTQERVTLDTTLDLDAMAVAWRQQGSTWSARIPPPPAFRPTVLRVVARDGFGMEIGRAFVEMGGGAQGGR